MVHRWHHLCVATDGHSIPVDLQLTDVDLDFRTVRQQIWKSGGEIKFHYALRRDDKVGRKEESLSL